MPPETIEKPVKSRSKDRHKARKMMNVGPKYHKMLKELARRNRRPVHYELWIALEEHLKNNGFEFDSFLSHEEKD